MKRVMVNCCMRQLKPPWLLLYLGRAAPQNARACDFRVAVNHAIGSGGSTFVGKGFTSPIMERGRAL